MNDAGHSLGLRDLSVRERAVGHLRPGSPTPACVSSCWRRAPIRREQERAAGRLLCSGFYAFACENPAMRWDFDVRHYTSDALQRRDFKADAPALLRVVSASRDAWGVHGPQRDDLHARRMLPIGITSGAHWRRTRGVPRMRRHARKLEACHHRPLWRWLRRFGLDPTGHGWDGWLHTEKPKELEALGDDAMVRMVGTTVIAFARRLKLRGCGSSAGCTARRIAFPPLARTQLRGVVLHTDLDFRPPGLGTRNGCLMPRKQSRLAAHRARCPGHACAVRSQRRGLRRGISKRAATLPGPRRSEQRRGGAARGPRGAGSDSVRRRFQHAATVDAVGYRAGQHLSRAWDRNACRSSRCRTESSGSLRGRGHSSDARPWQFSRVRGSNAATHCGSAGTRSARACTHPTERLSPSCAAPTRRCPSPTSFAWRCRRDSKVISADSPPTCSNFRIG